jgi:hypothetical protein
MTTNITKNSEESDANQIGNEQEAKLKVQSMNETKQQTNMN